MKTASATMTSKKCLTVPPVRIRISVTRGNATIIDGNATMCWCHKQCMPCRGLDAGREGDFWRLGCAGSSSFAGCN
jgi:hypothetical protein